MKATRSSTRPKKRILLTPRTPKQRFIRFVVFIVVLITIVFLGKISVEKLFFSNPILGTWRTQTTMGIREIVFERSSMTSFGTKNPVTYDVQDNYVVVMDPTLQLGNKYTIIDKNTISTQLGNAKSVYKRVQ